MWLFRFSVRALIALIAIWSMINGSVAHGGESANLKSDTLFQYSTINALLQGLYDGDMTLGELARHGDTGLGTINGVDGELIVIDGAFYNIKDDGQVYELAPGEKTPFAVMAFFNADLNGDLPPGIDYSALQAHLDHLIKTRNDFQTIRIDGAFPSMTVRSEPKQVPPYRRLAKVIKEEQVTFDLVDVKGTLIGFRMPNYVAGINIPGYHFHFLTDDRKRGGHVLALKTGSGKILVDTLTRFEMVLPRTRGFDELDLGGKREKELHAVEKQQ